MNIPLSWLQQYIHINDVNEFAHKMTMSGTKVENIHHVGYELCNIVVAKVISLSNHPNANLTIAKVDIGNKVIQMVTGATNLKQGVLVPAALPGAILNQGKQIQEREIRGEFSEGMLCSIEELGGSFIDFPESPEEGGIYIFENEHILGDDVVKILQLKEQVIEFEITTNRPDCYSVIGIVREALAAGFKQLQTQQYNKYNNNNSGTIKVEVKNQVNCLRYIAQVVGNVKIGKSPQWLRRRLSLSGIRPRNNIVDITNYVMLEYGQPLHAFDMKCVSNNHIIVRNATENEKITTLDSNEHVLPSTALVIADNTKPLAIAGIMGGSDSSITDSTTTVIFESANFYGPNIRSTSRYIGLRTDSSTKYEKGLDPNLSIIAINKCMELITQLNCGIPEESFTDIYPTKIQSHVVNYSQQNINNLLGTQIPKEEMVTILNSLEISTKELEDNTYDAYVPTFRKDISQQADIAEEIIRIHGFDSLGYQMDNIKSIGLKDKRQNVIDIITNTAISLGLNEIVTYSFESPHVFNKLNIPSDHYLSNALLITNPLGEEHSIMKTQPLGGMLNVLSLNYNRRNMNVNIFEIGKIYEKDENNLPVEKQLLTIAAYNKNVLDFFYVKGIVQKILGVFDIQAKYKASTHPSMHPGRFANIYINDKSIGYIGQVHPIVTENYEIKENVYIATINLEEIIPKVTLSKTYTKLPKYPQIVRDLSIKVKLNVTHENIENIIKQNGNKLLEDVTLFDVYQGNQIQEGYKSMAYTLSFRDKNKTLEDKEVNLIIDNIISSLKTEVNATLRE